VTSVVPNETMEADSFAVYYRHVCVWPRPLQWRVSTERSRRLHVCLLSRQDTGLRPTQVHW